VLKKHGISGTMLVAELAGNRSIRRTASVALAAPSHHLYKEAHRAVFDYARRDGYLYITNRAISSRVNDNHDSFSHEALKGTPDGSQGYLTFIGRPVFINHANSNHRRLRGVNVAAALHEDNNPDGSRDTWVELLKEIDPVRYPKFAQALLLGHIDRTSMGVDVDYSQCSKCGNVAHNEAEYCFVPGTLVNMADGTYKPIEQMQPGDRVLTHNGVGTVTALGVRHYDGEVVTIKRVGAAHGFTATSNHNVLANSHLVDWKKDRNPNRFDSIKNPENWEKTHAGDLSAGQWVQGTYPTEVQEFCVDVASLASDISPVGDRAYLSNITTAGNREEHIAWVNTGFSRFAEPSKALATLLGYYVAEGSVASFTTSGTPRVVQWSLHEDERWIINEIQAALDKLDAGQGNLYRTKSSRGISFQVSNAPLAALLCYLGGRTTEATRSQKVLAGEVMLAPVEFQKELLRTYANGDGWSNNNKIEARTVSGMLARQIVSVGARLSYYIPRTWLNPKNSGGPTNRAKMSSIYHVTLNSIGGMIGKYRLDEGYYANRIESVKTSSYHGPVYNITVDDQHTYAVEDTIVFNCNEIPALKGMRYERFDQRLGKVSSLIYEECYGLKFFEDSCLVEPPADPTAIILGIQQGSGKTASIIPKLQLSRDGMSVVIKKEAKALPPKKSRLVLSRDHMSVFMVESAVGVVGKDSLENATQANGTLNPEHQKLHDTIVNRHMVEANKNPKSKQPRVTFMGGGSASGKSSVIKGRTDLGHVVNSDDIKEELPEYKERVAKKDTTAAAYVHEESSVIGKKIENHLTDQKHDYTVDGTGDTSNNKMSDKIDKAHKNGYKAHGLYVTVDTEEAVKRAAKRAEKTGRHVPEQAIRDIHAHVSKVFHHLVTHNKFDSAELWDNNGDKPSLVGSKKEGGEWTVHHQGNWQKFLDKGKESDAEGPKPEGPKVAKLANNDDMELGEASHIAVKEATLGKDFEDTGLPAKYRAMYEKIEQNVRDIKAAGGIVSIPNDSSSDSTGPPREGGDPK
jgi:predicted ABC-type ATPase